MPKSSSSVMKLFRVRVDGESDEKVTQFCKNNTERFLLVHHITTTDNPHYHFVCYTKYSQGNFSNKIKSELGTSGGDYSNKTCDPDRVLEALSYLFNTKKGNKARTVAYVGYSVLDVATFQESAAQIATEFQTKMKENKKTQYDVAQAVIHRLPELIDGHFHVPSEIYDIVISVLKESKMMARPNHVKDIIATVMAYCDDKKARAIIKDLTLKFFSFDRT